MTPADLVLTVDCGGSSVKASVYSLSTQATVAVGAVEVRAQHRPEGFAEFDTERWWQAILTATERAVGGAARPAADYVGVTCTGMRIPFVLIDAGGSPLAPGVLNVDRRGSPYLERIRRAIGSERLYELTGHWPNAKLGLPKLLWFKAHRPELWRRVRHVLQLHDWLVFRLTAAVVSEPSSAAMSQLLDVRRRRWADELLAELGIDPGLLPPLEAGGSVVGGMRPEVAQKVGLLSGTPVHAGAGDTHLASLGAGGAKPGTVTIVGGTTTPLMLAVPSPPVFTAATGPLVSPHAVRELWAAETNTGASGAGYAWLRGLAGANGVVGYTQLDELVRRSPLGSRGLLAIGPNPEWGERGWEAPPPASLVGLTPGHSLGDVARSVLESIAYAIHANLEALELALGRRIETLVFTGGASRSTLGCQLLADVLGRPLLVPQLAEPASAGGASLVAGAGVVPEPPFLEFRPDDERHLEYQPYEARYRQTFRRVREALAG